MTLFATVIPDLAIDQPLSYSVPKSFQSAINIGSRVEMKVRGRTCEGYVLSLHPDPPYKKMLELTKLLAPSQAISEDLFKLAQWMSQYYVSPLRNVLKMMIPGIIRKNTGHKEQLFVTRKCSINEMEALCRKYRQKHPARALVLDVMLQVTKGILLSDLLEQCATSASPVKTLVKEGVLSCKAIEVDRNPLADAEYFKSYPKKLNTEQNTALTLIHEALEKNRFEAFLLHGVTGSGKTEVYLQAIEYALKQGKGSIMLIPEIALTPQTVERFLSRFDEKVAIQHHRLSEGERHDQWHKIREGKCRIVIGARSAIFSPVQNLGLVIVDEEHESSYKQTDKAPCYHARDLAVVRAKLCKASAILGTATPSLESYYNSKIGKYTLLTLNSRVKNISLPTIHLIDMKPEHEKQKGFALFSDQVLNAIEKRYQCGEQSLLFLNRRGYHTSLMCQACGDALTCEHCSITLSFHRKDNSLSCHLCGSLHNPPPRCCPSCHSEKTMKYRGVGTELVESSLHAIFPDIRTIRADADTTKKKGSHQKIFKAFRNGKADVLIGTQMIAKGLHFPQVTLVVVLNSDASLNFPDFRASEHAFQMLTQVAGRSGRHHGSGEVMIQTASPENRTLRLVSEHDVHAFYDEELEDRQLFNYPPYTRMIKLTFSGKCPKNTEAYAQYFHQTLQHSLLAPSVLHPLVPCGYAKVKDLFRFQTLVRGPNILQMNHTIQHCQSRCPPPKTIKFSIDVDPNSTFF